MIKVIIIFYLLTTTETLAITFVRKPDIKNIDNKIYEVAKPATLNYMMEPFLGVVDGYWVSRLGNTEKLGGQGCADQIFNSFYRFIDFFPSILAPEVSKLNAQNKTTEIQNIYSSSLMCSSIIGIIITFIVFTYSDFIVKLFIKENNLIYRHVINYLKIRILGLPFALTNSIIFSVLRGMMDFKSALYINFRCQIFNLIGDPILMKFFDIQGLALATIISEILCTYQYLKLLSAKNIYFKLGNSFLLIRNMFKQSIFVQLKNICHNLLIITTNNKITSLDYSGKQVAAHILSAKLFDLGCIFSRGLHSVSSIMISSGKVYNNDKIIRNRLFFWSNIIGFFQLIVFFNLKYLLPFFTSDIIVLDNCKKITHLLAIIGYSSCILHTMDGILQGYQKYKIQAFISIISLMMMLVMMSLSQSLSNIWLSYLIVSISRILAMIKFI